MAGGSHGHRDQHTGHDHGEQPRGHVPVPRRPQLGVRRREQLAEHGEAEQDHHRRHDRDEEDHPAVPALAEQHTDGPGTGLGSTGDAVVRAEGSDRGRESEHRDPDPARRLPAGERELIGEHDQPGAGAQDAGDRARSPANQFGAGAEKPRRDREQPRTVGEQHSDRQQKGEADDELVDEPPKPGMVFRVTCPADHDRRAGEHGGGDQRQCPEPSGRVKAGQAFGDGYRAPGEGGERTGPQEHRDRRQRKGPAQDHPGQRSRLHSPQADPPETLPDPGPESAGRRLLR